MPDTCDTGKAFAGLVRRAREGFYKPEDNVLFFTPAALGDCSRRIGKLRNKPKIQRVLICKS